MEAGTRVLTGHGKGARPGVVRRDYDGPCDWVGCRHDLCVEVLVDGETSPRNFNRNSVREAQ